MHSSPLVPRVPFSGSRRQDPGLEAQGGSPLGALSAGSFLDSGPVQRAPQAGFSMVELLVALAIAGLLLAVTVPSFKRFQESADLRSGAQAIATQLMVARQKAIATGTTQELRLQKNFGGTSDYHIWSGGVAFPSWRLPANLNYYWGSGTQTSYRMTSDGRCMDSGLVILENSRGARDTISVRVSGLIVVY